MVLWLMKRYGVEVRQARSDPMSGGRRMPDTSLWGSAAWRPVSLREYVALEGRDTTFTQWIYCTAVAFQRWTSGRFGGDNECGMAQLLLLSATYGGE